MKSESLAWLGITESDRLEAENIAFYEARRQPGWFDRSRL